MALSFFYPAAKAIADYEREAAIWHAECFHLGHYANIDSSSGSN